MKILAVTANFGGEHFGKWVEQRSEHSIDFVRYNDRNFPSRQLSLHPRLKGKIPKMLAWQLHPGYDYYIWLDSRCQISKPDSIDWLIKQCDGYDLALFNHPYRSTVNDELEHVIGGMNTGDSYLTGRYKGEAIQQQYDEYIADINYTDNSLFACTYFIYHKNLVENKQDNILKEWLHHNVIYSIQDQLSLPYLLQKYKTNYTTIKAEIFNCPYFLY